MSINSLNNFPLSQKLLKSSEPLYLFDVGARRGFHPVFNNFKPIVKIGFEPSKIECDIPFNKIMPKSLRKTIRKFI
jgi:hypothetical protein